MSTWIVNLRRALNNKKNAFLLFLIIYLFNGCARNRCGIRKKKKDKIETLYF